jgi:hypothetical protein
LVTLRTLIVLGIVEEEEVEDDDEMRDKIVPRRTTTNSGVVAKGGDSEVNVDEDIVNLDEAEDNETFSGLYLALWSVNKRTTRIVKSLCMPKSLINFEHISCHADIFLSGDGSTLAFAIAKANVANLHFFDTKTLKEITNLTLQFDATFETSEFDLLWKGNVLNYMNKEHLVFHDIHKN